MPKILIPTNGPDDWKRFLADPEKQWRSGYSAKALVVKCQHIVDKKMCQDIVYKIVL